MFLKSQTEILPWLLGLKKPSGGGSRGRKELNSANKPGNREEVGRQAERGLALRGTG